MSAVTTPGDASKEDERLWALRRLEEEVATCQRCLLAQGRTHAVPGEGNPNATVLFIGEAPGAEEDRSGRPFVGRSGQYLTEVLARCGVARSEVYITNIVKCRPPGNRDPLPDELAACEGYLLRQIEIIRPRIIVTLGRLSMRRWFPEGSITRLHGCARVTEDGRVVVAMFHPAAALRNPQWRVAFEQDMARLPALIERVRAAAQRGETVSPETLQIGAIGDGKC